MVPYQWLLMLRIAHFNFTRRVYMMNLIAQKLNSIMLCWLSASTRSVSTMDITSLRIHGVPHGECRATSGCAAIFTINVVLLPWQVILLFESTIVENLHYLLTSYSEYFIIIINDLNKNHLSYINLIMQYN